MGRKEGEKGWRGRRERREGVGRKENETRGGGESDSNVLIHSTDIPLLVFLQLVIRISNLAFDYGP